MEKILIDTSAWIEYFRGKEFTLCDQILGLILEDRITNCGLVEFELLHGARKDELPLLDQQLKKLNYSEMTRQDFRKAAELSKLMKSRGKSLKFIDLAIAAFCIERDLILLTLARDFKEIPGLKRLTPNLI
jgi:predicted nucleic acid-binding protein